MSEPKGVQTDFTEINGGKLYYEVAGKGPALVLAHAGIADRRMWDDQFLVFAQHYRVIRFDFWGFGKSILAKRTFFLHQDLYQLLKFLGVEQAHLIGSSLGGTRQYRPGACTPKNGEVACRGRLRVERL